MFHVVWAVWMVVKALPAPEGLVLTGTLDWWREAKFKAQYHSKHLRWTAVVLLGTIFGLLSNVAKSSVYFVADIWVS